MAARTGAGAVGPLCGSAVTSWKGSRQLRVAWQFGVPSAAALPAAGFFTAWHSRASVACYQLYGLFLVGQNKVCDLTAVACSALVCG
jgi:hypothetical protein